ncbi:pyrimidine-nucleoside phosphorylase [Erysipelothrix sp. HDW6C]|uniref:pyrimidine-nucleoside phosphorylase n=1 Tax=Erysipelothrix sp. HDW6C TaxID=2714930 RepID=UPI001408CF6B|nr:pyrimidine-nucleoside phosphorylase [Erysipelothrix sp. HDW6C]QIK70187.1 pyrimidine-nucleoside phosphorylase [Erysipelothrix sp. HDW6C]
MRMVEIIEKKRDGLALSDAEIKFWIEGVSNDSIPDYQTSALLMAIVLKGMTTEETTFLTEAMLHSGDIIDLSAIAGKKVDKHSTGGVGDKTTIILSPLVAAAGAKVAKMSGRGLGHTGGTLDKLESIPGYNIELSSDAFIKQVNDINVAVVGQTGNLVYADKVLYSLRDVTGTVNALPLIASSIMSKKLAGGADCILLDVKYGEGAFMKTVEDARELAQTMIAIGKNLGREVNAMLTNMNQPLGNAIGNALEVEEAILTLKNEGPKDLEELCLVAAGYMLFQAGFVDSSEAGYDLALETLRSEKAYDVFLTWIAAQGGDISVFDDLDAFTKATYHADVIAQKAGHLHDLKALELGMVSTRLGAGRETKDDIIDYKAGIILNQDVGNEINVGDKLATLYSDTPINEQHITDAVACFVIDNDAIEKPQLIADVL